jgi:hypothetical protein
VEDDPQNAVIYAENRDRPAAQIEGDVDRSWAALSAAIEACTETDLARPHPHAPAYQVWEMLPGVEGHVGTHLMFWFLDNADEAAAESAARWAYDLESSFFSDPVQRADAAYNLACFYARVGRAEEALRLLRESLAAKPALVPLARRDPDLDRIRDRSELGDLLAT